MMLQQLQLLNDLLGVEVDPEELALAEKRYAALERNYVRQFNHYPEILA